MNKQMIVGFAKVAVLAAIVIFGLSPVAGAYESQINQQNMVVVEATPVQLASGKPAQFKISLNTHSVGLDNDMVEASVLIDGQGHQLKPDKWEGSPAGGHHRAGELFFPALANDVQSVKLVIKGIGGVPERAFEWKIER